MAWAYVQTVPDGSLEEYDKVTREMGDIGIPEGLIIHVAGKVGGGIRIINVWESEGHYERFRDETLIPAFQRAFGGMPDAEATFERMDVHHLIR